MSHISFFLSLRRCKSVKAFILVITCKASFDDNPRFYLKEIKLLHQRCIYASLNTNFYESINWYFWELSKNIFFHVPAENLVESTNKHLDALTTCMKSHCKASEILQIIYKSKGTNFRVWLLNQLLIHSQVDDR